MRSFFTAGALVSLATSISATGILLPLYLYPAAEWNDGGVNWNPVFKAVNAHPHIDWTIIVNPSNGPGPSGKPGDDDVNIISGVSQLNAFDNVKTVGYVRTNYAQSPMEELKANITNYANWASYTSANISMHGIFFDETDEHYDYLNEAISFARDSFDEPITTICNFGTTAPEEYYEICDIVVGFESCLNCGQDAVFKGQTTLKSNFPAKYKSQGAVIINQFNGEDYESNSASDELVTTYAKYIVNHGLGWFYFCTANYDDITTTFATVGQNAMSLVAARLAA